MYATLGSVKNLGRDFRKMGIRKVIVDECHYKFSPDPNGMFRKFLDDLKPTHVLGFTATPFRLNQYGTISDSYSRLDMLHTSRPRVFSKCLGVATIQSMIEGGYWTPLEYIQYDFNSHKLRLNSSGAEFTERSVKAAMREANVLGKIERQLREMLQEGYKSILVFLDSIESCNTLLRKFPQAGVVTAKTKKGSKEGGRDWIINQFKDLQIPIVFNVGVLTTGFDHPELEAIIMGKPTNSLALYYQMVGRVTRIHESKPKAVVVDFAGNVERFGRLEDLNFEEVEGYGLGFFSGDRLLTNTRLDLPGRTKSQLRRADTTGGDPNDYRMPFGKHKGKKMSEVPLGYQDWCLENMDGLNSTLKKIMEANVGGKSMEGIKIKEQDMAKQVSRDRLAMLDFNNILHILFKGGTLTADGVADYMEQLKHITACSNILLVVDSKSKEYWRKKPYPKYKANRNNITPNYELLEARDEVLEKLPHIRLSGLEADDVFATYVRSGQPVTIISSDSDFKQLFLLRNFEQFNPLKRQLVSATKQEALASLFTKTLKGDRKDNIGKSHNLSRINSTQLSVALQRIYGDMLSDVRREGYTQVQEIPLRHLGRKHLSQFDLNDLYELNFDMLTLLYPKFEKYTKWTEEKILSEVKNMVK
jgi:DNA repair protein RadD